MQPIGQWTASIIHADTVLIIVRLSPVIANQAKSDLDLSGIIKQALGKTKTDSVLTGTVIIQPLFNKEGLGEIFKINPPQSAFLKGEGGE